MIKNKVKLYDDTPVFTEPELELDDHNKPWKRRKVKVFINACQYVQ